MIILCIDTIFSILKLIKKKKKIKKEVKSQKSKVKVTLRSSQRGQYDIIVPYIRTLYQSTLSQSLNY